MPLPTTQQWWLAEKTQRHTALVPLVEQLDQHQDYRNQANITHIRLYGGAEVLGLGPGRYSRITPRSNKSRITWNVISSVCDTARSKIAKNRPAPLFLTEGGNFEKRRRGRKLTQFVSGTFYELEIHRKGQFCFQDATVVGTGFMKIYREGGTIKAERVFPGEIIVDDMEGYYGEPCNFYQVKYISRDVLRAAFPDSAAVISGAAPVTAMEAATQAGTTADMLKVTEAWHLRSGNDTDDGRHSICIKEAVLLDEAYDRDRFPFIKICWNPKLLGYFGRGLAEELTGIQIEINRLLMSIADAHRRLSVAWILAEAGSNVVPAQIRNEHGNIIYYHGQKPEVVTFQTVHPEIYQHLQTLYERAYEIAGISRMAAQARKPEGLDSGVALREFNDIESERFVLIGQEYENFFMEAAKHIIELAREIEADDSIAEKMSVKTDRRRFVESIDWKDVDLQDEDFVMKVFPVSSLPSTPAGKFQAITERIQAGFIGKEQGMRLLDYPDLSADSTPELASLEITEWMLETMLDKGKYVPPDALMNLDLGMRTVTAAYLTAVTDNAPEHNLDLLRQWIAQAQQMIAAAQQSLQPQNTPLPAGQEQPGATSGTSRSAPGVAAQVPGGGGPTASPYRTPVEGAGAPIFS